MIRLFAKKKLLWFPTKWANAVTTWIQNIRSPEGSLQIRNTCMPKDGESMAIDIDKGWLRKFVDDVIGDRIGTSISSSRYDARDDAGHEPPNDALVGVGLEADSQRRPAVKPNGGIDATADGTAVKVDAEGGVVIDATSDGLRLETAAEAGGANPTGLPIPTNYPPTNSGWGQMLRATSQTDEYNYTTYGIKFYPPIFDEYGRFTGAFSATGIQIIQGLTIG